MQTTFGTRTSAATWLRTMGSEAAPCQLLCLPYAGGSASIYNGWDEGWRELAVVRAVQLPGRGPRMREPAYTRMEDLTPALAEAVAPLLDRPTILLGYSNGGLQAYDLALHLQQRPAGRYLRHLVIAASRPPHMEGSHRDVYQLPDAEFINYVVGLNGMPAEIATNRELLTFLTPMLRADFELGERYRGTVTQPLDIPLTTIGGTADHSASPQDMAGWRKLSTGGFTQHLIDGGHFFLNTERAAFRLLVEAVLRHHAGIEEVQP